MLYFFPLFTNFFWNKSQIVGGDQGEVRPIPPALQPPFDGVAVEVAVAAPLHGVGREQPQDLRALVALIQRRIVKEAEDGPSLRRLQGSLQSSHLPVEDLGVVGLLVLLKEPSPGPAQGVVSIQGAVVMEKVILDTVDHQ